MRTAPQVVATREIVGTLAKRSVVCTGPRCGMLMIWGNALPMALRNTSVKILLEHGTRW
eukprot:COSAG02_NODE_2921_length_7747_cov_9.003400_10_plen_59_part_00